MSTFRAWGLAAAAALVLQLAVSMWTGSFIRNPEMRAPYAIVTVLCTLGFLFALRKFVLRGWLQAFLAGATSGYFASFIALQIAKLFDKGGGQAAFRGISEFGFFTVVTTDLAVTLVVGGWLTGAIVSMVLRGGQRAG